jgi:hypothetical protein
MPARSISASPSERLTVNEDVRHQVRDVRRPCGLSRPLGQLRRVKLRRAQPGRDSALRIGAGQRDLPPAKVERAYSEKRIARDYPRRGRGVALQHPAGGMCGSVGERAHVLLAKIAPSK